MTFHCYCAKEIEWHIHLGLKYGWMRSVCQSCWEARQLFESKTDSCF